MTEPNYENKAKLNANSSEGKTHDSKSAFTFPEPRLPHHQTEMSREKFTSPNWFNSLHPEINLNMNRIDTDIYQPTPITNNADSLKAHNFKLLKPSEAPSDTPTLNTIDSSRDTNGLGITKDEFVKRSEAAINTLATTLSKILVKNQSMKIPVSAISPQSPDAPRTWKQYVFHENNLAKFWHGTSIGPEELDSVIETFTLVNTLLLSIPFNCIGTYKANLIAL